MALEVVDKRNTLLVRVAEILQVLDNKVLIHFGGWDNKYDYWEYADSPDLHPVGWCSRTGHALQAPLTPLDIVSYAGICPTLGCYGYGHIKGAKYSGHHRYGFMNSYRLIFKEILHFFFLQTLIELIMNYLCFSTFYCCLMSPRQKK